MIRTPGRLKKTFGFAAACASALLLLSGCGGGGGGGGTTPPPMEPPPPPPPQTAAVSGTISFQRIGFNAGNGNGLNASSPLASPARGVVVEALSPTSRAVLDTTITDANGAYSLTVPVNTMILVSAKAQMLKIDALPTWNVRVLNNANGDALYTLESSPFDSGTTAITGRNLLAATGFDGTSYTGTRAAAPFAILDTILQSQQLVIAGNASTAFPALSIFWSGQNRTTAMQFCVDTGDIGSSFYIGADVTDDCSALAPAGIYLLGAFDEGAGDTDEFDQHVIAHEFGHYIEDKFSRSDSIGGEHSVTDLLDLRVAFSEGWGNAVSAMTLNDPAYRDSFDGFASDFGFNLERDFNPTPGWYSETSAGEIIWDLFDGTDAAESFDTIAAGFAPIFAAMRGQQRTTEALASVFSFLNAYNTVNSTTSPAVAQLSMTQQIAGTDDFGSGETNDGGDPSVLPVYQPLMLNQAPLTVCTNAANGDFNKLGFRKFFVLTLPTTATISVVAQAAVDPSRPSSMPATDPDLFVFRRGVQVASGQATGPSETIPAQSAPAGTYVIEAFDFDASGFVPRCMTLTVTGG